MKHALLTIAVILAGVAMTAVAGKKDDTSYNMQRSLDAMTLQDYDKALEYLDKELLDHPKNGEASAYFSAIKLLYGEVAPALTAANNSVKYLPRDKNMAAFAYSNRGDVYLALGDTLKGLDDYAIAIKIAPESKDARLKRAQLYSEMGKYDLSDADYDAAIALDEGDVESYIGRARNANKQKRYDAALKVLDRALKLDRENGEAFGCRSEANAGLKKYNAAVDDILSSIEQGFQQSVYFANALPDEAFPLLKLKLELRAKKEPQQQIWPYVLAMVLEKHSDNAEAAKKYMEANAIEANPLFLKNAANCLYEIGNYAKAVQCIDQALNLTEGADVYDELLGLRALYLLASGNYADAKPLLSKLIDKSPDISEWYGLRGVLEVASSEPIAALEDFNMYLTLEPNNTAVLVSRGDIYDQMGKKDLAKADYEKVLTIDTVAKSDSYAPFAHLALGNKAKAYALIEEIIQKDTTDQNAHYQAACLYSRANEVDKALTELKKAVGLGYTDFGVFDLKPDLKNLRAYPPYQEYIAIVRPVFDEPVDSVVIGDAEICVANPVVEVPFTREGGVTKVKCTINGLPLHFVFDTGAADVTLSMVEANFMVKNGYIKDSDIIGSQRYIDANGDVSEGTLINLRSVDFGGLELPNVRASVVRNQRAPLLLGQSVLGRLGKVEIDNKNQKIKITPAN